jgi:hypothetical protein
MESKKINQLATEMAPAASDLTIIGDPITGVSKKITLLQLATTIGAGADLQQVTDNGATTTNPIAIGGLTITGLATGVLKSDSGVISSVPFGAANGVATLGGDGKVPSIQLPSYVDDVVEVANFAALPVTGETGKIYITLDNNKVYRWTGSIYVEIAANNAVWGAITGTLSNQTDLQNALNAKQNTITLTTTGTSGASTLVGSTLNIPNYAPDLSGYVPYTGATANVNLGTFDLTADIITGATGSFASSGGSDTFAINHSSGSGIALNITKGGNGEGLYINKTSGSGNAATIIGTLNATTLVKSGGTSSQFLKADGSVDSSTYLTTSAAASTYVTLGTTQTITGDKIFSGNNVYNGVNTYDAFQTRFTLGIAINQTLSGGAVSSHTVIGANVNGLNVNFPAGGYNSLNFASTSVGNTYTFPNATGTLALTTDLGSYLPLAGGTMTGQIVLKEGTTSSDFTKGLRFPNDPFGGSGDIAGLRLYNSTSENMVLELYTGNDAADVINFATGIGGTANNDSVTINGNKIWNAGNLANPISGTGTTNYIPKFTASGTIGNSIIYDLGTRIAIGGTSATDGVLTVQSDSGQFCIQSNTTPGKQLQIGYDHISNNSYLSSLNQGVAFTTLALQPNGGNVHVGGSTSNGAKLQVTGDATFSSSVTASGGVNAGDSKFFNTVQLTDSLGGTCQGFLWTDAANTLKLGTGTVAGGNVKMTITSGGNVGIGTSSPSTLLQTNQTGASGYFYSGQQSGTEIAYWYYNANEVQFSSKASSRALTFLTNDTPRMTITSGGEVLMNTSSTLTAGWLCIAVASNNYNAIVLKDTGTSYSAGNYYQLFTNSSNTVAGSITHITATTVLYNTSSDYRLKEDLKDFNGLDILSNIKFYDFKWKDEDIRMHGVIAHELQEIVPLSVSGTKDELNDEGNIAAQGVDYSKLVPILGKAIQELEARIKQLENK